jgi:acetyl-CoA C-acetyltransferase
LTLPEITAFAEDPTTSGRRLVPVALPAGDVRQVSRGAFSASTVLRWRRRTSAALANPAAAHGAALSAADVMGAEMLAAPLTRLMAAPHADGAIVFVLASSDAARGLRGKAVRVRGVGWANDTPAVDSRDWDEARYARKAGEMAYRTAGIRSPQKEIHFAEVDDTFAHKELMHLEALGLLAAGAAGAETARGATGVGGSLPVNVSGGSLGEGLLLDATGLARALEVVLQLRGEAGGRQLAGVQTGLAFGWRGLPTTSGAAVILGV